MKATILTVDDDVRILRMMKRTLELEGYQVLTANTGEEALNIFNEETPALILLDIKMPDTDGYTLCRCIREFSQVPIIMVTAMAGDEERVQGLDAGADDYITKPFAASELTARVRAVLRRAAVWSEHSKPVFRTNNLIIDLAQHRVFLDSKELNLTSTEYRLLSYMAINANRVVTLDQLLEKVWGEGYLGKFHLLQVTMARLRRKLNERSKKSSYILTRPGMGYMMLK